jgi:Tfp pilus assembly protein PilP
LFSDLEFYAKLFNNRSKLKAMSNKEYQRAVKKYKGLIEQANGTKLLPTPLQANYGSLKLVGVIWKGSERVALVEIQGNKGHTVKKGVLIGPKYGVVDSIQRDEIVVKENSRDYLGNIVTKKKEIEFSAQSQE